jgi:hypothetical protein
MFQRLKSVEHSPILNFVKSKKRSITALGLASLSVATLAITTGIAPVRLAGIETQQKAAAWQSWEHPFGPYYNFSNKSQSQADSICRNATIPDYRFPSGYVMYYGDDGYTYHSWEIRFKWAHRSAGRCVFNT